MTGMALLDYWLVARMGSGVRRLTGWRRGSRGAALATCRRVGSGETVTGPDLKDALDAAFDLWLGYVMSVVPLTLLSIPLVSLLPNEISSIVFSLLLGAWIFGVSSMTFTLFRVRNYVDADPALYGSRVQSVAPARSQPRARDSIVSLVFAGLAFVVVFMNLI